MQHTSETSDILETYACNIRFQRNTFLLLGGMEAHRRVEFTGVELAGGTEIAAPVEKATAGSVEKPALSLHTVRVEHELCAG